MKKFVIGISLLGSMLSAQKIYTKSEGLRYQIVKAGKGKEAVSGKRVRVHYTGWLLEKGDKKGKQFDTSRGKKGRNGFVFQLGAGMVIRGWDEGVTGMKVGEKRRLFIPSALGYGQRGAGGAIPPGADLVFDVELLETE